MAVPRDTVTKALVLLGCVTFAAVAIISGIDRQALGRPSLAKRVPTAFAAVSPLAVGQSALYSANYPVALANAELAVRNAPVEPESAALLGAARLGMNDPAGADQAFRVAGQLGWRVALAQAYWMAQALTVRDYKVAALRLDALLRQHPWMLEQSPLIAALDASESGRAALADRLMTRPPWAALYASNVSMIPDYAVAQRAQVLRAVAAKGLILGCDSVAPTTRRLILQNAVAAAAELWRAHCPEAGTGTLTDPEFGFLRVSGARTPLEWDMLGSSDVGMVVVTPVLGPKTGRANMVDIHTSAAVPRAIMRQGLTAQPGRYRLTWQASGTEGSASAQITASLGCQPDQTASVQAVRVPGQTLWTADVTIGADCALHWLVCWIHPSASDVRFGQLRLEQLR